MFKSYIFKVRLDIKATYTPKSEDILKQRNADVGSESEPHSLEVIL